MLGADSATFDHILFLL